MLVGCLIGTYLLAIIALSLPTVQGWLGGAVSSLLSDWLQTRVMVERVQVGLQGRIIVDGIALYDRQDTLLLRVARVATKMDLLPLARRQIRILNAQLFGARATVYQPATGMPTNAQFLIDALAQRDTTRRSPIDLQIGSLLLRRCQVRFDRLDQPLTPERLTPHHLCVTDISATAEVDYLTPDSLHINLRRLSFREESGIHVRRLSAHFTAGPHEARLEGLTFAMNHSELSIPQLALTYAQPFPLTALPPKGGYHKGCTPSDSLIPTQLQEWLTTVQGEGSMHLALVPSDLTAFAPRLSPFDNKILLDITLHAAEARMSADIALHHDHNFFSLAAEAETWLYNGKPEAELRIASLRTNPELPARYWPEKIGGRIGATQTTGSLHYAQQTLNADLHTQTSVGTASVKGSIRERRDFQGHVALHDLQVRDLLQGQRDIDLTDLSLEADIQGKLPSEGHKLAVHAEGVVNQMVFKSYPHRGVRFGGQAQGKEYSAHVQMEDVNGQVDLSATANFTSPERQVKVDAIVHDLQPFMLNLSKRYEGDAFSGELQAGFNIQDINHINGAAILRNLRIASPDEAAIAPGDLLATCHTDDEGQHINIESPFLVAEVDGAFKWQGLAGALQELAHHNLPSIFPAPRHGHDTESDIHFSIKAQDSLLISRLTGTQIRIPQQAVLQGSMESATQRLVLHASVPSLVIGTQDLRHLDLSLESNQEIIQASLQTERLVKGRPVELKLNAYANQDKLRTQFAWDNKRQPSQQGTFNLTGIFRRDLAGGQTIQATLEPSQMVINDTLWDVRPATITYHDGAIDVRDVQLTQGERFITINGRVSKEEDDTLTVDLRDVNLSYVFDLANFHAIDLDGSISGRVYARTLLNHPFADGYLHVNDFYFNRATMGEMDLFANWGRYPDRLYLNADLRDLEAAHHTTLTGTILPKAAPVGELDLNIQASNFNLYMLNKYTEGIFTDFQGRGSGWLRVFGKFKRVNLEGDMLIHHANVHVNALGATYHTENDSVSLRPDNIWIRNAILYDRYGSKDTEGHQAMLNGHLMHEHMSRMRYDFDVQTHNILSYDFPQPDELNFFGTVYSTGHVHLYGQPGTINVDIEAKPERGTLMHYNVQTPETLTEAGFITYINRNDSTQLAITPDTPNATPVASDHDMKLNFDLNITPEATMRLIMDPRSGDYIDVAGNGRIHANFYNKAKFRMYGTFTVDNGRYKMSLQNFIRKDFELQPGGTINFNGDAYQAALNLKAIYTVPNVSLEDLSASSLGLSNTRVNCIMNIGGRAKSPLVTFDFDLPNASEDEKQMVRSMLSTEEERNMQVIYLLGIGRFYNNDAQYSNTGATQSTTAMNSLLAGTLSSQLNQVMTQALGSNNWSFGTNLRTGETGWDQLDVEGILSGRLLNNRLLLNGNFGYRENLYNNNNFIGDFDILYKLTPSGTWALKAYNQTNDRYFIQNSLTTQGVGLQFKRDFNLWKEAFRRQRK